MVKLLSITQLTALCYDLSHGDRPVGSLSREGHRWTVRHIVAATGKFVVTKRLRGSFADAADWIHTETPRIMALHYGARKKQLDEIDRRIALARQRC